MTAELLHLEDDLVLTPPTARVLAQQEAKRLALVSALLMALLCLCALATMQFGKVVSANYAFGVVAFLPPVF